MNLIERYNTTSYSVTIKSLDAFMYYNYDGIKAWSVPLNDRFDLCFTNKENINKYNLGIEIKSDNHRGTFKVDELLSLIPNNHELSFLNNILESYFRVDDLREQKFYEGVPEIVMNRFLSTLFTILSRQEDLSIEQLFLFSSVQKS